MNVQKWLESVKEMDDQINDMLAERAQLWALATSTTAKPMDGMPFDNTGTVSRKMENAVCAYIDLDKKIDALIDRFIDRKRQVLLAVQKLPELEEDVLYRHYIKYEPWAQIAAEMGCSRMQLWRIRQRAYDTIYSVEGLHVTTICGKMYL